MRTLQAIRNPVLQLPAMRLVADLPPGTRLALAAILLDIAALAHARAETSWRRRKSPMALYWRSVSTYCKHIARAVRNPSVASNAVGAADQAHEAQTLI